MNKREAREIAIKAAKAEIEAVMGYIKGHAEQGRTSAQFTINKRGVICYLVDMGFNIEQEYEYKDRSGGSVIVVTWQ